MSNKIKLIIIGGRGDGLVAASMARADQFYDIKYEFIGFLNDHIPVGDMISGYPVIGKPTDWSKFGGDVMFYIALHKVKEMPARVMKIESLGIPQDRLANIIHKSVYIGDSVKMGYGCLIAQNVVIQPNSWFGVNVSVRAGVNIGHDAILNDFSYVGPNAVLCGGARLEKAAHLGPNSTLENGCLMGEFSVVSSNTAIMKDTEAYGIYMGNPARQIRSLLKAQYTK
jgi:acetyltransferase EpsM